MPTTTKLTSIRLDEEVLQKIEEFVKVHRYWNRSGVINNILGAVLTNFKFGEVYDMVRTPLYRGYEVDCHYEITEYRKKDGGQENGKSN